MKPRSWWAVALFVALWLATGTAGIMAMLYLPDWPTGITDEE